MNPEQTAEACDRCTKSQQKALTLDAAVVPLANDHIAKLGDVNAAEQVEKEALAKQVAAQEAYNAANNELKQAKVETAAAKQTVDAAAALERAATSEANSALKDAQLDCKGFNLPVINQMGP